MQNDNINPIVEKIWMEYFNNYLYKKGTISEREWSQMSNKILSIGNINKIKSPYKKSINGF